MMDEEDEEEEEEDASVFVALLGGPVMAFFLHRDPKKKQAVEP